MNKIEHLRKNLYYDESVLGCLRWKVDRRAGFRHNMVMAYADSVAGGIDMPSSYYHVSVDYVRYRSHRVIWEIMVGEIPSDHDIDHINHDRSDNRLSNLRCIPSNMNSRNCPLSSNNTSGIIGVSRRITQKIYPMWRASWRTLEGQDKEKCFSVLKYGEEEAFKLACKYRKSMIDCLNRQGAGYTDLHGVRRIRLETSLTQSCDDSPTLEGLCPVPC
jgi:hypothetical protein